MNRTGSNNSNWKGGSNVKGKAKVKERARHYRQEAKRGSASEYKCRKCGAHGASAHMEWADVGNGKFVPMCKSCHTKYDNKVKNIHKMRKHYESVICKINKNINEGKNKEN